MNSTLKKVGTFLAGGILSLGLCVGSVGLANADETGSGGISQSISTDVTNKADGFVSLTGRHYSLDSVKASAVLTQEEIRQVQEQVSRANKQIDLVLQEQAASPNKIRVQFSEKKMTASAAPTSGVQTRIIEGVNKVETYWWGVRVFLSRSTLQYIGGGVAIGGLWIPEALASKIASTLGVAIGLAPGGVVFDSTWAEMAMAGVEPIAFHNLHWQ